MNVHSHLGADRVGIKAPWRRGVPGRESQLPEPCRACYDDAITLTPDQAAWLDARVAAGEFDSAEDAVRLLLDDLMAEAIGADDLDWAKPLIEEGRISAARGDVVSLEEHRAHTEMLLKRLGAP